MEPYIELTNVSYSFGNEHLVLDGVTLSVAEGEYVGLVGANGSGKTTLLKIILGLIQPTAGTAKLFGQPADRFVGRDRIGYVPQHVAKTEGGFPMGVREVVASGLPSWSQRWNPMLVMDDRKAIQQALNMAQIEHLEGRLIGELSGGERQRVFIARALVSRPKLLILDEPTTGIDAKSQNAFYGFLGELNTKIGLTILLVSHDLEVIAKEVKTVACLNKSLVCHVPSEQFIPEQYLADVYGKQMHTVHHRH